MQENVSKQEFTPIVQEESFPKPTSRLSTLMSEYRQNNGIPERQDKSNPLANVKVVKDVKTRDFSQLKENEKQQVLSMIDGIDYLRSGDIQTFGSAKSSPMTKHAEIIISKYSAGDVQEISDPMTELVATLKSNNPREIVSKVSVDPSKEWGIFSSIRDSILKNIEAIEVELKKQQIGLQKDIKIYEDMGKDTYTQISDFELDCIALDLMIEDAESKLDALTSKDEMDLMELNQANELRRAIDRMNRRKYTIQTVRISTVQSVPQLAVLIYGDEIICEKIDEIESLVIPLWTWQYAIAVGAIKQQEALSIQKTIRGITSKLLTGNAKMLHDNMISAQEELYSAAVAIEDLVAVQEYIDDMVTKVNQVRKEASKKCAEGMQKMKQIEQKNYALMSQTIGADSPTDS